MKAQTTQAGTCRVCGCTDQEACEGGCTWVEATQSICSVCFGEQLMTAWPLVEKLLAAAEKMANECTVGNFSVLQNRLRACAKRVRKAVL